MSTKPKLPSPREADIQRAVMDYLAARGFRVFRRNTGAVRSTYKGKARFIRFSQPGQADLYGWHIGTGRHIEVEIKKPRAVLTPQQREWLLGAKIDGVVAFSTDSVERCAQQLEAEGF